MSVTILEIAKKLNLSHTTVSRVLNNKPNVWISADTRQRVLAAAREMGYRPNMAARSLRDSRTNIIGVFAAPIIGIWRGITPELARGITEVLHDRKLDLFFALGADQERGSLPAWSFDGAIVLQASEPALVEYLSATEQPFVCVNEYVEGSPAVMADDAGGVRMAMEHLWELGHRRIAYANVTEWHIAHPSIQERRQAYADFMAERGVAPLDGFDAVPHQSSQDDYFDAIVTRNGATAVLAYDHVVAVDLVAWASRRALRIPADLSLITFNDEFPTANLNPPITVVAPQGEEMGRRGAELLFQVLDGGAHAAEQVVRVQELLILRESTAPPRA